MSDTYNPWTIVNLVFHHLAEKGFRPTLGAGGDPGEPAAALLRCMGLTPTVEGDRRMTEATREKLAELRETMLD